MQLRFVYTPVSDLEAAKAFYVGVLGGTIAWEEGADTCGVTLPGDRVQLLLDVDPQENRSGPFYVVPSVHEFVERLDGRAHIVRGPDRIPPGWYVLLEDPDGNPIRVMDDTTSRERAEG